VLFTDAARFGRDGIINIQNQHQWAEENPHGVTQSMHSQKFSISVWAGIVGACMFFHIGLQAPTYMTLPKLLEDVPLPARTQMQCMQDGALAHFSCVLQDALTSIMSDG
jgi:hypothetical protein